MRSLMTAIAFTALAMLPGCDEGLAPDPPVSELPGFSGTVSVISEWPTSDSVRDFRVVAFRSYPPSDIRTEVINGTAVFSDELAYATTQQQYTIANAQLHGVYEYIVVAQQYGANLFMDWRVVGVFTTSGDVTQPSSVDLGTGRFLRGIDIEVDFDSLPPQPF